MCCSYAYVKGLFFFKMQSQYYHKNRLSTSHVSCASCNTFAKIALPNINVTLAIGEMILKQISKVNAFNFVNVVDALYYSKYFLTLTAVKCQHPKAYSVVKTVGTLVSSERDTEVKSFTVFLRIMCANITVVGDGRINEAVYKGLRRRVIGIAMQNPGILESCRK
ncbi:uncharacterized protein LOC115704671 isoform X2 [Cannabis sativa]|uniref:uncharacterized protein LOC115704671 isoform X2 n=1 Tax=Cannabis sativa TaxID=3483 RepID=UPI0029CA3683|nr:uncharacterized protein LOC115704671 isoform X2 [Cannabis sativa]